MIIFCINFELSTEWIWMNIKDHFCLSCHFLPVIALYPTQQNWKCLHIRNRQYREFHISNFWSRRSLGRKLRFLSPLGFHVQTNSDHKTQKIKLHSIRVLKCYLNEKNLIHGQIMATISKFSPQIFETYFRGTSLRICTWRCVTFLSLAVPIKLEVLLQTHGQGKTEKVVNIIQSFGRLLSDILFICQGKADIRRSVNKHSNLFPNFVRTSVPVQ